MNDLPEFGDPFAEVSPGPRRPGEDHADISRCRTKNDWLGRRTPARAWRGFPLSERSWDHGSFAALSRDEAQSVLAILTLNVVCRGAWGRLAERTGDAGLRWRFARNAQIRDECANELQEILCEIGEGMACPAPVDGRAEASPRSGAPMLQGPDLSRALRELQEQEQRVKRKYEELLISASRPLHAVLARQWLCSREIEEVIQTRLC